MPLSRRHKAILRVISGPASQENLLNGLLLLLAQQSKPQMSQGQDHDALMSIPSSIAYYLCMHCSQLIAVHETYRYI